MIARLRWLMLSPLREEGVATTTNWRPSGELVKSTEAADLCQVRVSFLEAAVRERRCVPAILCAGCRRPLPRSSAKHRRSMRGDAQEEIVLLAFPDEKDLAVDCVLNREALFVIDDAAVIDIDTAAANQAGRLSP